MAHAEAHPTEHAGGHSAHHRNYVKIWAILTGLLVVSVIGPMLGIRVVTLITAFGIALVKAYLVAKNFMHLDIEKPIVGWLLTVALILMVVLYAGVAPDVEKDKGQHWVKTPGYHYVSDQAKGSHHSTGESGSHSPDKKHEPSPSHP
jgi:caa(3)-type oxidase subunit IV